MYKTAENCAWTLDCVKREFESESDWKICSVILFIHLRSVFKIFDSILRPFFSRHDRVQLLSNRVAPCVGVCLLYKNIGPIYTALIYLPPEFEFVRRRSRFSGMERNLGYLTAGRPPALDLDLSFQLGSFLCGCKHHNSKRGSFWQASERKFSQSEWKNGLWRVSAIFANFRLFSLIFGYFRLFSKSVYQVNKISQFRLLIVLSLFLERFFFGNHLFSDFIILFVKFGFYANHPSYSMVFLG
jgi:hypothetical protein